MSNATSRLFIVEAQLTIVRRHNSPDSNSLLRRAVGALGSFAGHEFVPESTRGAAFLRGELKASRISLSHPKFTDHLGYPNSWLSVAVDTHDVDPLLTIFIGIHMGRPGEQIDLEWSIGLKIMPRLVAELAPTLGFMNGRLVDEERRIFPAGDSLSGPDLPEEFTPWTYIDGERLDAETRPRLSSLKAVVSAPLGHGWIVQAVKALPDRPDQEFLNGLKTLGPQATRYLGPVLTDKP